MRHYIKSKFLVANVNHLPDNVSYNTLFSDTTTVDDSVPGYTRYVML